LISFMFAWPAVQVQPLGTALLTGALVAVAVTLLESLETPVDDNYLVGLGATLVAALLRVFLG